MVGTTCGGVLTLLGEGASPRVVYDVIFELSAGQTVDDLALRVADQTGRYMALSLLLDPEQHPAGSRLIVRTERIESLVIYPSDEQGQD